MGTTINGPTWPRSTGGSVRPTTGSGRWPHEPTSSSRPPSPTGTSTSRSRRGASTSSELARASGSGRGISTTAWLRRRRSTTASSTRGSWIASRVGVTRRAHAGSSSPGMRTTGARSGDSMQAQWSRRRWSSATRSISAPGTASSTRSRCGGEASTGPLDVRGRRPGRRGACVRRREGVHRHEQRERLRGRREQRTDALARDLLLALRAARVFLRDAYRRLRPRLRRQCGRHGLRLRSLDRRSALGTRSRHLRLHRSGGVAKDGLRRKLGRQLHRARRAHGRLPLALRGSVLDHRRAHGSRRARLLRDVHPLRVRRASSNQGRPARDLRSQRTERAARLAVSRRKVLTRRL